MVDPDSIPRLMEAGTVEVAPLAYMRGRTLNDAFIILDEAQNTSAEQMKMFLTRLGFGSKMVVTGDVTQVDLPGAHDVGAPGRRGDPRRRGRRPVLPADVGPTSSATGWSATSSTPTPTGTPRSRAVSIEVNNECGHPVDEAEFAALAGTCWTPCACTRRPSCRSCWSTRR